MKLAQILPFNSFTIIPALSINDVRFIVTFSESSVRRFRTIWEDNFFIPMLSKLAAPLRIIIDVMCRFRGVDDFSFELKESITNWQFSVESALWYIFTFVPNSCTALIEYLLSRSGNRSIVAAIRPVRSISFFAWSYIYTWSMMIRLGKRMSMLPMLTFVPSFSDNSVWVFSAIVFCTQGILGTMKTIAYTAMTNQIIVLMRCFTELL